MSKLDELKKIDIVSWLENRGHRGSLSGNRVRFRSPFRPNETKPSFTVFLNDNSWADYGISAKPTSIIDLVMQLEGCSLYDAMDILAEDRDVRKHDPIDVVNEPLLVVSKTYDNFISPELIMYLRDRGIPKHIYHGKVVEAHYYFSSNKEKIHRAVGFKNDSGGYELRSSKHKYATSPKDITTVTNDGGVLNLYEGFISFMSSLVYFGVDRMEGTTIVLNGLGMVYRIINSLSSYQKVNCFFDWGVGGDAATDMIRSRVGIENCYDHRYIYPEDMDFNDIILSENNK